MKKIYSPIKRWPGYIGMVSPFGREQAEQIILTKQRIKVLQDEAAEKGQEVNSVKLYIEMANYLFSLVEEWGIEGLEPNIDSFTPPLKDFFDFIGWWFDAANNMVVVTGKDKTDDGQWIQ